MERIASQSMLPDLTRTNAHALTFHYYSQLLNEIMPLIYKRFTDKAAEEWRQIYKVRIPWLFMRVYYDLTYSAPNYRVSSSSNSLSRTVPNESSMMHDPTCR